MKQLAMLLTAGVMAFVLSGCGEDKPKQPEVRPENAATQPMNKSDEAKPADTSATPETTGTSTEE
ncbi:hypothetical protein [Legionella oakridgensis]|uniref:Uncharacterized protein n=2 Tax=Legionella oakridgensis TaxID=29423 RepID=W0BCV0_9GAMM|nr:hypothetical protein [Legionella oakridgensis]AHE66526.1 hypothetical protein Loa_00970 [Legionella oakridgensis ATCC 33761 = DSM 21215]ETO93713.1 hypothetical protein LOR_62c15550 [Legionella oakridgensis RV-2-2007]KTD37859.1 hypothetical protein Loak_1535 [Legionella oakridgensis]STY19688.1 Uncharacterised protein [Legionella longbeachae]